MTTRWLAGMRDVSAPGSPGALMPNSIRDEIARLSHLDLDAPSAALAQALPRQRASSPSPLSSPAHHRLSHPGERLRRPRSRDPALPRPDRPRARGAACLGDKPARRLVPSIPPVPERRSLKPGTSSCASMAAPCTGSSWSRTASPGTAPPTAASPRWRAPSPARTGTGPASSACATDRNARQGHAHEDACAAPSTPASRPSTGSSRSSTRSITSARPQRPTSRARPMRAGGRSRPAMTMAASPAAPWTARPCSGSSPTFARG